MKRTEIEGSSNIAEAGYDYDGQTMEIKFHNGSIYQYWPITRSGWDLFTQAKSKGSYFAAHIRGNSGINYKRVDELQSDT